MKQIALACLGYEQTYKLLPPRSIYGTTPICSSVSAITSATVLIAPFMEQNKIAQQINYGYPWWYWDWDVGAQQRRRHGGRKTPGSSTA